MQNIMNKCKTVCCNKSTGLLIIRIVVGIVFISHGWDKLAHLDMTAKFFGMVGIATWLAPVVGVLELLSGLMLVTGIFAQIAGGIIAIIMLGVIIMVKFKMGFNGYQYELVLLAIGLAMAVGGPGKYAIWNYKCWCKGKCGTCGSGASDTMVPPAQM